MRKGMILAGLLMAGVFAVGFAAGQIGGIGRTSAATKQQPAVRALNPPPFAAHGFTHSPPALTLGPRADGTVTAVNGNTITVKPDGDRGPSPSNEYEKVTSIRLTSSTKYFGAPGQTAKASDIKVGSFVVAEGTLSSDQTTLTASKIMAPPKQGPPYFGRPPAGLPSGRFGFRQSHAGSGRGI